jgi:transcriptional regulator
MCSGRAAVELVHQVDAEIAVAVEPGDDVQPVVEVLAAAGSAA